LQQAFDLACNQLDLIGLAAAHQPRLFVTSADLQLVDVQGQDEDTGGKMSADEKEDPWWKELAGDLEGIAGLNLDNVSGDVIVANVGAGAQNVAVGKGINQQIGQVMGSPKAEDAEIIQGALSQIAARLVQADVDPRRAGRAEIHLEMLQEELTKVSADAKPNAEQIQKSGDWLVENIPEITQALAELFGLPAVGRVLGKAGAAAVEWAQRRWRNG
jgi:hypothetical protein